MKKHQLVSILKGSTPRTNITSVAISRSTSSQMLVAGGESTGKVLIWNVMLSGCSSGSNDVIRKSNNTRIKQELGDDDEVDEAALVLTPVIDDDLEPIVILPHEKEDPISCVCFGNRKSEMLCSASSSCVKLWNVLAYRDGFQDDGVVIGSNVGNVSFVKFSDNDELLYIGLEDSILIYHIELAKVILSLEGHQSPVTEVLFLRHLQHCIISVSEDRTFKIWDIYERKVLYKSGVLSPYPIISVCEEYGVNRFMIGFSNGIVQIYETKNDESLKCLWVKLLHEFDLNKKIKKFIKPEEKSPIPSFEVISSEPIWRQQHNFIQKQFDTEEDSQELTLCEYSHCASKMNFFSKNDNDYVMICSKSLAVDIDLSSFEIERMYDIANVTDQCKDLFHSFDAQFIEECSTRLVAASAFQPYIYVMDINHQSMTIERKNEIPDSILKPKQTKIEGDVISMTHTDELPNYLRGTLVKVTPTPQKKTKALVDKPSTFSTRIKSSGYSEAPFVPAHLKKKPTSSSSSSTSSTIKKTTTTKELVTPSFEKPPINLSSELRVHNSPILCMSISPNKESIVTGSNSGLCMLSKLPLSNKNKGVPLEKHSVAVNSINWTLSSKLILTSSSDNTATIWKNGKNGIEPAINFKSILGNIKSTTSEENKRPEQIFKSSVNNASFFHQDRFTVLSSSNKMYIYKYYIHKSTNSDEKYLKKQVDNHKYKLGHVFESRQAQKITALTCPNSYLSNYILLGYSSKTLEIYDVCKDTVVRSIENAHERPIHTISLNNSPNATSDSINFFLTSSVDGCVKLWDARQQDPIRRYSQHKNSIHSIGNAISPCMRYIACGSEDRCVYLYDLTTSEKCIEKIIGYHSDVVSDVKFKNSTTLLSCSFDGKINTYSSVK
ncbi:predicted protein [Naegleria gruberi]|uniref:Predicted protein n=1 Tax=Naegleria gruberi TaxID=5762 RepID=D2VPU1_NAEGR|nr:uncharacterized protein NAEGRDRAFT_51309 [Naegleria gruberi]EFC41265.1 predicted protein [Naegleria gruberi]|eukprot:XP_002674009.1 predicted protein [Naegleria gruberi strain NEG-M]